MDKINQENWTYTHYALGEIKSKICLGGELDEQQVVREIYYVSVLDAEHQEISQKEFYTLEEALQAINQGHQSWNFTDETKQNPQKDGGGCSTCVAH
jgi:hypothetical protein